MTDYEVQAVTPGGVMSGWLRPAEFGQAQIEEVRRILTNDKTQYVTIHYHDGGKLIFRPATPLPEAPTDGITHDHVMEELELGITTWRCNP